MDHGYIRPHPDLRYYERGVGADGDIEACSVDQSADA